MINECDKVDLNKQIKNSSGYYVVYCNTHPLLYDKTQNIIYVHRYNASIKLNRWILSDEHVHHIDGDTTNNSFDNLEILTNAEHQQTHKGKREHIKCVACGIEFLKQEHTSKYCSIECSAKAQRKVNRPNKDELYLLLKENSFLSVGKMFGVSDNAIRKWCKSYDLPTSPKYYKDI